MNRPWQVQEEKERCDNTKQVKKYCSPQEKNWLKTSMKFSYTLWQKAEEGHEFRTPEMHDLEIDIFI